MKTQLGPYISVWKELQTEHRIISFSESMSKGMQKVGEHPEKW